MPGVPTDGQKSLVRDFPNQPRAHRIHEMVNNKSSSAVTPGRKTITQARPLQAFFNAGEQTKRGPEVSKLSALLISAILTTMTHPPTTSHDLIPLLRGYPPAYAGVWSISIPGHFPTCSNISNTFPRCVRLLLMLMNTLHCHQHISRAGAAAVTLSGGFRGFWEVLKLP